MPPEEPSASAQPLFGFDGFHVDELILQPVERVLPSEGERQPDGVQETVQIGGALRIDSEGGKADLKLSVDITPDPKWKPYRVRVVITGRFRRMAGSTTQFDEFVRMGAPSILFPYIREIVHRATMDSRYGLVRLNPMNLQSMLAWKNEPDSVASLSEPISP